jgi:hypothetical protein
VLVELSLGPLVAATPSETVDVLVTWIGGLTLVRYRFAIARGRGVSPLERSARVLVSTIALLLVMRGFSWLHPDVAWLGTIMLLPATLLPIAITMFAEGLQRRHAPAWIKGLAVAASGTALVTTLAAAALGAQDNPIASSILLIAIVVVIAALFGELVRRDTSSLSRAENGLIRAMLAMSIIAVPLIATDFRFVFGWPPARLGTLAPLLLCYTLLRRPEERGYLRRWALDVLGLLVRAAIISALLLIALSMVPHEMLVPLIALVTTLVLALAVNDGLGAAAAQGEDRTLLRWLARPPADSLAAFVRELRHLPLAADAIVISHDELSPYHAPDVLAAFGSRTLVRARTDLRAEARDASAAGRGADELSDLLERTGMTHVALLTELPLRLLLANVPELPGSADAELALAAIVRRGRVAVATESARLDVSIR